MEMNWLEPLALMYSCLFIFSLLVSRARLLAPSIIFFASFSTMLVCSSLFNWYFQFHIKLETFAIMTIAALAFLLTEILYRIFTHNSLCYPLITSQTPIFEKKKGGQPIIVHDRAMNITIVFMFLCLGISVLNLYLQSYGASWNELMHHYNHARAFTKGVSTWRFTAINQLFNLVFGLVYVNTYILVYNKLLCGVALVKQKKGLFVNLLFVPFVMIASSGRQPVVELVIYTCLLSILLLQTSGRRLNFKKLIPATGALLAVFLTVFTLSASYVGRSDRERNVFAYVGEYLCGGLANFNAAVGRSLSTTYWGENTFANFYAFLSKFNLVPAQAVKTYHAFGWRGKLVPATTVTTYGRWYEDFGAVGVYIMTALMATLFSYLFYSKVIAKAQPSIFPIVYLHCGMALVWASYDDRFYALLSVANCIKFFWMAFFYWQLVGSGKVCFKLAGKELVIKT